MRMAIEFKRGDEILRTVTLNEPLHNLAVGQRMAFDHPQMKECLSGRIINIQHVVFLGSEKPLTYVDVEV